MDHPEGAGSKRADPPSSSRLRYHRHCAERRTLAQLAESGNLDVRRQATWGMSVKFHFSFWR